MKDKQPWHLSGRLHVTGRSRFIGEERPSADTLHAAFFLSPVAHAEILHLNTDKAKALSGVTAALSAADIPGVNQIGHVIKDEPLFPEREIMFVGQPLAMVLSPHRRIAEDAVHLIELEYRELHPILSIDEADELGEWYVPERKIEDGDVERALAEAEFTLSGTVETPAQEHFYLETQRCLAVPGEGGLLTLYTATQSTMEVQEVVSYLLGIPANRIVVDVMRLGGAFGGKERAATIWACLAALGAHITQKPVLVLLDRTTDMLATGKRHPFKSYYRVGFDQLGKVTAYDVQLLSNGGAYADLSIAILERAMFHAENAYHIPHIRIRGRACRTNLPPNTAFRGFGAPQGIFVIESVLERIAQRLQLDPLEVRLRNLYQPGDYAPYGQLIREASLSGLFDRLKEISQYDRLKEEVKRFNEQNQYVKQGIGVVPVKFGISFTTALLNQGSALIWIYIDGTVSVTTGGVEMGQELSTKMALVVSRVLGISLQRIRVESSNSQRVGNASPTAASTGSDINGNAARIAAEQLKDRLVRLASSLLEAPAEAIVLQDDAACVKDNPERRIAFADLIREAYNHRVALGAHGYYATPEVHFDRETGKGQPFAYYVYGCALVRTEVNLSTGEHRLLDVFIVHETGPSLHPDIDRGQIVGAFIQAYGWCTMEEIRYDEKGRYLALSPSTYKIPCLRDLPENLVVEMVQSPCAEASVLGSKAVGEPPFIYGEAVWFANQHAVGGKDDEDAIVIGLPITEDF